jgi:hypothetical protein
VVDAQQRVWFLDMNTDVRMNPHAYRLMLRDLFGLPLTTPPPATS